MPDVGAPIDSAAAAAAADTGNKGKSLDSGDVVTALDDDDDGAMKVDGLDDPAEDAAAVDFGDAMIALVAPDGGRVNVRMADACISTLIKTAWTDSSGDKPEEISVTEDTTTTAALEKVVEYMIHHKNKEPEKIPMPLTSKLMEKVCSDPWDATFINGVVADGGKALLYVVIRVANYLGMDVLLHLGCARVGSMIKGQPLEKLKSILDPAQSSSDDADAADADGKSNKKQKTDASASASASSSSSS
jgi:hypothetical protein